MIIWLASYPKSGNTWLRFYIISLLMGKQTDLNLNHLRAIMNYPHSTHFDSLVSNLFDLDEISKSWITSQKKINSDKCVIEANFKISPHLIEFFEKHDLDFDDTTIIRREINVNGKIRNFINDTPVTASVLSNFSSLIIEIHAQHHNLLIKSKIEQLSVIDKIANNEDMVDDYFQILNK